MNGTFFATGTLRPFGQSLKRWLAIWTVSEVLVFLLAVKLLGLGVVLLLMFASSVLGVTVLRRVGLGAAQHLRRHMADGGTANEVFVDGSLTALGAFLLILPGFVSDAAGLALAAPSIRQRLASRFIKPATMASRPTVGRWAKPDVIDLAPEDWRVVERPTRS